MGVLSAWLKVFCLILVKPMPSTFRQLNEMTVLTSMGTLVWCSTATLSLYAFEALLSQTTASIDLSPIWLGLSGLSCVLFCAAYGLAYLRQHFWHRRPVAAAPLAVALGAIYVLSVGLSVVLTVLDIFLVSRVLELRNEFLVLEGGYYLVLTSIAICTLLRMRVVQKLTTLGHIYAVAWLSILRQILLRPLPSTFRQLNQTVTLKPLGAILWSSIATLSLYGLEALLFLGTGKFVDVTLLWLSLSGLSCLLFCVTYALARLRQRFWHHRNVPVRLLVVALGAIYTVSIGLTGAVVTMGHFLTPSLHEALVVFGYSYHVVLTSIAVHTLLGLRVISGSTLQKVGHACMTTLQTLCGFRVAAGYTLRELASACVTTLYAWIRLFRRILLRPTPSTFHQMRHTTALTLPSAMFFQCLIIVGYYLLDGVHAHSGSLFRLLSNMVTVFLTVLLAAYSIALAQRILFRRTAIPYRELVLGLVAVQAVSLLLKSCLVGLSAVLVPSLGHYIPLAIIVYQCTIVGIVVYAITGLQIWQSLVAMFVGVLTGKAFFTMIVFLQSTPR